MSDDVKSAIINILSMTSDNRIVYANVIGYKQILEPINGYEVLLDNHKAVYIHRNVVNDYCQNPAFVQADSISRIVKSLHNSNE